MKHLDNLTIEELDYIKEKYNLKKKQIPRDYRNTTGNYIYYLYKDDTILYVGKTSNIKNRIESHLSITDLNKYEWKREINKVYVEEYNNLKESSLKEGYLINTLNPPNNVIIPKETENIEPIKEYWYEIKDKSIKIEDVLDCLQNKINNCSEPINVAETIRESLYHPSTSRTTISNWYRGRNRDKIEELATNNNCHIEAKSGRGGGFFIVFDWLPFFLKILSFDTINMQQIYSSISSNKNNRR